VLDVIEELYQIQIYSNALASLDAGLLLSQRRERIAGALTANPSAERVVGLPPFRSASCRLTSGPGSGF
jgi:hypothetical protein